MFEREFIIRSSGCEVVSDRSAAGYFNDISIDSRKIVSGDLFIAIRGDKFDGHDFINEAFEKGAAGVILERVPEELKMKDNKTIMKVRSTAEALGQMANTWRNRYRKLKVVCITGTNGKTTTKEITAGILSVKKKVLKNQGNLNNHLGLPLTLLKLNDSHDICVAEIGMNDFGEIRQLTSMAQPDIGAITNIGRGHLEKMKTLEGVAKAKGEMIEKFGRDNDFIVNVDDPYISIMASGLNCRKITYGLSSKSADIHADNIRSRGTEAITFDLIINGRSEEARIKGFGTHNVMNALCASAIACSLGYSLEEIVEGIKTYEPVSMRLEIIQTDHGFRIINDSYNANPTSMSSALTELSRLKNDNKVIAVLGDMLELGSDSGSEHKEIGRHIKNLNIDMVITYGERSKLINEELEGEVDNLHVETHEEAARILVANAENNDFILLKGSRGMKMENTIKFLN